MFEFSKLNLLYVLNYTGTVLYLLLLTYFEVYRTLLVKYVNLLGLSFNNFFHPRLLHKVQQKALI